MSSSSNVKESAVKSSAAKLLPKGEVRDKKCSKPQRAIEESATHTDDYEGSKASKKNKNSAADEERRLVEELSTWKDGAHAEGGVDDDF
jgi:hypothetical protein